MCNKSHPACIVSFIVVLSSRIYFLQVNGRDWASGFEKFLGVDVRRGLIQASWKGVLAALDSGDTTFRVLCLGGKPAVILSFASHEGCTWLAAVGNMYCCCTDIPQSDVIVFAGGGNPTSPPIGEVSSGSAMLGLILAAPPPHGVAIGRLG